MGEIYIKKKKRGFNCLFLLLITSYSSFMEQIRGGAQLLLPYISSGAQLPEFRGQTQLLFGAQNREGECLEKYAGWTRKNMRAKNTPEILEK